MRFLDDEPIDPDCTKRALKACDGEPFFGEQEGKRYCVLHVPGADKKEAFDIAFERKQASYDSNYQGVWFPPGNWFTGLEIRQPLDFTSAVFNDRASFYKTTFKSDVKFRGTTFEEDAWFGNSTFGAKVDFSSATFRKKADFGRATFSGEVDFSSVSFRDKADFGHARFEAFANFWRCTFTGDADFRDSVFLKTASFWPGIFNSTASFTNASFVSANFRASEFNGKAVFTWCAFRFATFRQASFNSDADFFDSRFEGTANFAGATFNAVARLTQSEFNSEARFEFTTFNGEADFSYAVFKDLVSFSGEHGSSGFGRNAAADFRNARFEMPSRISFHGLTLRPHWFVNLDPREFEFVDVKWKGNLTWDFIDIEIRELKKREELEEKTAAHRLEEHRKSVEQYHDEFEIERLKRYEAEDASAEATKSADKRTRFFRLLSITCRQLAVNSEENHRYDQASNFRFWSMELLRKEGWRARGRLSIGVLHTLYRYLSGYGEEIGRAFLVLVGICLLFAFLYTRVGFVRPASTAPSAMVSTTDEVGQPQKLAKALPYSLAVLTLQRPDPRPLTATAWFTVLAETIVGPIQAALLILAVRRRFMR